MNAKQDLPFQMVAKAPRSYKVAVVLSVGNLFLTSVSVGTLAEGDATPLMFEELTRVAVDFDIKKSDSLEPEMRNSQSAKKNIQNTKNCGHRRSMVV
jgi:hypothetical protein